MMPTVGVITALDEETLAVEQVLEDARHATYSAGSIKFHYIIGAVTNISGDLHNIVLMQANKGNNAAAIRASQLLSAFPSIQQILMVGIAGGVPKPTSHQDHVRLGDIIVSDERGAIQFDFVKQAKNIIPRPPPRPPGSFLIETARVLYRQEMQATRPWCSTLRNIVAKLGSNWRRPAASTDVLADSKDPKIKISHPADNQRKRGLPRLFVGPIAASNTLLKNPKKRDQLRDAYSVKAIEMEGSGIADAAWSHEVGYLIIRGICDYCDSGKNDTWHYYAAAAAASFARTFLEYLPVAGVVDEHSPRRDIQIDTRKVLFEIYDKDCEPHYLQRYIDSEIIKTFENSSLWLFGESGRGKTSVVRRLLIQQEITYLYISLGNCVNCPPVEVLRQVYIDLSEFCTHKPPSANSAKLTIPQVLREIQKLLEESDTIPSAVYIDELPIPQGDSLRVLFSSLTAMIIGKTALGKQPKHRFLLSSIDDPRPKIHQSQQAAYERIVFKEVPAWSEKELLVLGRKLRQTLPPPISEATLNQIVEVSKGSPRRLKRCLSLFIQYHLDPNWPLSRILREGVV